MYTVDASVWVSGYFQREASHRDSRAFLERLTQARPTLFLPRLAYVEVAGAVNRISGDALLAMSYADAIARLPFVRWVPLNEMTSQQSASLATRYRCTLVTLDGEHLSRLPATLPTLTPAAALATLPPVS